MNLNIRISIVMHSREYLEILYVVCFLYITIKIFCFLDVCNKVVTKPDL